MDNDKIGFLNTVVLPDESYDVIREIADAEGKTVAQVVSEAISEHLKNKQNMLEKKGISRKPSLLTED